jgi:thiol-disulfide isomerase/thioredoxin
MKKLWKPLVLIAVIGVIAFDLFLDTRNGQAKPQVGTTDLPVGTTVGKLAPDFTGNTLGGETIRLSDFRGKVVLVNDFASWCGPCLLETPHLVEAYNANIDKVVFIGLNMQENVDAVAGYRDDFQVPYPLVLNRDGTLIEIYKPIGLPTSWIIDASGVVQYVHTGPMTASMLQNALDEVFAGRTPDFATISG